jgi:hypothetical protein
MPSHVVGDLLGAACEIGWANEIWNRCVVVPPTRVSAVGISWLSRLVSGGLCAFGGEVEAAVCGVVGVELVGAGLVRRHLAVADGGAFFVGGEEGCFRFLLAHLRCDAGPECFAFGGEGVEGVEVGADGERFGVAGCEPGGEDSFNPWMN